MHYNRQCAATFFAGTDKSKLMGEAMAQLNQLISVAYLRRVHAGGRPGEFLYKEKGEYKPV